MVRRSTPRRFGVLGSGDVGQALAKGLTGNGYEVRIGTRSPGKLAKFSKSTGIQEASFQEVASWAEALVLAVLGGRARGDKAGRPRQLAGQAGDRHHQPDQQGAS